MACPGLGGHRHTQVWGSTAPRQPKGSLECLHGAEETCPWPGAAMARQPAPPPPTTEGLILLCRCAWQHRGAKPSLPPHLPHQCLLPAPTPWSCLWGNTNCQRFIKPPCPDGPMPAGQHIPCCLGHQVRSQASSMQQEQAPAGALSSQHPSRFAQAWICFKEIKWLQSQPASPERARAAPYRWANRGTRKAPEAGLAACPAGIWPCHSAWSPRRTTDPLWPAP